MNRVDETWSERRTTFVMRAASPSGRGDCYLFLFARAVSAERPGPSAGDRNP